MRRIALVSVVLFGCDRGSEVQELDNDLPARLECTSSGYYAVGGGNTAWRGTLDTEAGAFDFVAGPHHLDAPFPGDVEYPEIHATGAITWDDGTLALDGDLALALDRVEAVKGFLVSGTLDVGADEPVDVFCWNPELTSGFAYDAADGVCRDADGNEGTEPRPVQVIRETGDGQCADLRGVAIDEGDLSYQSWTGFDLRGADLTGASLHFAHIQDSSLEGAQMETLDFGYAEITGTIDDHTTIPAVGCEASDGAIDCMR